MIYTCRWLLTIDAPPVEGGWFEIEAGTIARVGQGPAPRPATDLGDVAVLPGLVNAHTHLELSWMAGLVPPADSLPAWIRDLMRLRRSAPPHPDTQLDAARAALAAMRESGTVLVGDVSNTLSTVPLLAAAGVAGVVFHELIGFAASDPAQSVNDALQRIASVEVDQSASAPVRVTLSAHAPYSVSPALFREIAARVSDTPLTVHLGESAEEVEFLRTGKGPMRELLEHLGAWTDDWPVPRVGPVEYMATLGYLRPGMMAVHGVHLKDDELERLRRSRATVVTCPRSNLWVGAGMPRVSHFYGARVPVAIGTDSLASVASLNLFDELAELRRIAPDVTAASLLESATRIGAEALGFGDTHGILGPGRSASLVVVDVPANVPDVEEYLVSGVAASSVRRLH